MKKKKYVERVNSIFSITNVANLFVTMKDQTGTDARQCIVTVAKNGRTENE